MAMQSPVRSLGSVLLTVTSGIKTQQSDSRESRNMLLLQEQDATLLNTPLGLSPFLSRGLNVSAQSPEMLRLQTELAVSVTTKCPAQHLCIQLPLSVHKQALWTAIFPCEM